VWLLLGCAVHPRAGRRSQEPYRDVPVAVAIAAGTGTAATVAAGVATAAAVTVVVGTVVVGAEQFPDPPAGTPPTSTAPKDPPNRCRQCNCYKRGLGRSPKGNYRTLDGGGVEEYTRETCQEDCKNDGYTGFECAGDKGVSWFN